LLLVLEVPSVEQDAGVQLLHDALESYAEGLKYAKQEATTDRSLKSPDDLLVVAATMDDDERHARAILEVLCVHTGRSV
jgi:hypothetical protein